MIERVIAKRVAAAMEPRPPHDGLLRAQQPIYDLLNRFYFRLEVDGWDRVPDETCLVIGVHSGGALTMDAWTLVNAWHTHFDGKRPLHGTAHDVLMATPGLGDYFRLSWVLSGLCLVQARCWWRLAGQHSPALTLFGEVSRQTVRPLVVRRFNGCWDVVPPKRG